MFNLTGQTLGKYRLVEPLGQGGMAQVYKAYQPDLDRHVAIKVLHPHLTADEEFGARFRREAQAIAALEHPNIVRVYDFHTSDSLAFLVMECLEGQELQERLRTLSQRGERLPLDEVERIVCALADALDYAHQRGVVHRDLKASNIVLTPSGRPVLTDFGIARMIDATAITAGTGGTLGTPAYMSPEQARGEAGDARSDVYSLGVLLYVLCTGRLPFDAPTPYAIMLKHITEPLPPPRTAQPDLAPAVEGVITRALAKDPDERFQTAGELGRALAEAMQARDAAPLHQRAGPVPPSRQRLARPVGLVALLLLASLVLYVLTNTLGTERVLGWIAPQSLAAGRNTLVFHGPGVVEDTWLDPDSPDEAWLSADTAHLQGPNKPDRILFGFNLTRLPPEAVVISATLTLHVEPYRTERLPSKISAHRMMVPWRPSTATYKSPWSTPGLAPDDDYERAPLGVTEMPERGWVTIDVTTAVSIWQTRGRSGGGLVVMLTPDSHPQSHYWVYMSEQMDPIDRPTLRVTYEVNR